MAKEKAAAKDRFTQDNSVANGNALSDVLRTNCTVQMRTKSKNVEQAVAEWVAHTTAQVNAHTGNIRVLNNYISAITSQTSRIMRTEPVKAEAYIAEIEATVAKIDASTPSLQSFKRTVTRRLALYRRQITSSKRLLALVGKPQFPIGQADWVNVDKPLTMESLKGKVVLIDFWAVWCGPCIATFPHLREWHEKHSDEGLVIVGATRYYKGYGFNKGRLTPAQTPLGPAEEQKMLQSFVDYHKLHHAIAVIDKDNKFHSNYGVQGIPQAVIIDRAGKIRMIRVGSGEANARELDEMIKKCLAEKAPE